MKAGIDCPKCNGSMLRSREGDIECFSCGYEQVLSVPIGQNRDTWAKRTDLPS